MDTFSNLSIKDNLPNREAALYRGDLYIITHRIRRRALGTHNSSAQQNHVIFQGKLGRPYTSSPIQIGQDLANLDLGQILRDWHRDLQERSATETVAEYTMNTNRIYSDLASIIWKFTKCFTKKCTVSILQLTLQVWQSWYFHSVLLSMI